MGRPATTKPASEIAGPGPPALGYHHDQDPGGDEAAEVQPTSSAVSQPDRQRALSRRLIRWDVAQVVDHQQSACQESRDASGQPCVRRELFDHDIGRTDRGDQAEEDEHEHLAQPEVAIRLRAARVAPTGQHREQADDDEPPRRGSRQHQPGDCGDSERRERGTLDLRRLREAAGDQPHRADTHIVGPADSVAVVVRVVDADLQRQADDQRRADAPPDGRWAPDRRAGTDRHRYDRCRKGARSSAEYPPIHGVTVAFSPWRTSLRSIFPAASNSSTRSDGSGTTVMPPFRLIDACRRRPARRCSMSSRPTS